MEQQQEILNVAIIEYIQQGRQLYCKSASITSKDEAIHTALVGVKEAEKMGQSPVEIIAIYSEWKPSDELYLHLKTTYPKVHLSYSYEDGDEERFKEDMKKLQ